MKQIIIISIITIFLVTCGKKQPEYTRSFSDIVVIGDTTDPHQFPSPDHVLGLYAYDENVSQKARFTLRVITDRQLSSSITFALDNAENTKKYNTLSDPHYREKLIEAFYTKVNNILLHFQHISGDTQELDYSECFSIVSQELNRLAKSNADKKIVYISSDIRENTDIFSCYSNAGKALIQNNPDSVANLMITNYPLPDTLIGTELILAYTPKNRDEEKIYLQMVEVYRIALETRGVSITMEQENEYFNNNEL